MHITELVLILFIGVHRRPFFLLLSSLSLLFQGWKVFDIGNGTALVKHPTVSRYNFWSYTGFAGSRTDETQQYNTLQRTGVHRIL
jgi:hypothetical protein